MSIASKLEYLDETKNYIRQCIQQKGVTVPANTTFRKYGDKILEIETEQHPPGWEGEGGGKEPVELEIGRATATGKEFVLEPSRGYDGFSIVNVTGEPNLKPENIAYGVTIYGVTGTMEIPVNMFKIPSAYEELFEQARELYGGDYEGLTILESDNYVAFGFLLSGFNVVSFNEETTEYTATRWVYVAYTKSTKSWKVEDHTSNVSGGGSFIKNIRYCNRYLYYGTRLIYPFFVERDDYEEEIPGGYVYSFVFNGYSSANYQIVLPRRVTIDWGDGSDPEVIDGPTSASTSGSTTTYNRTHKFPSASGTYTVTITGLWYRLLGANYSNYVMQRYITSFLTPLPSCLSSLDPVFEYLNEKCTVIPENFLSECINKTNLSGLFKHGKALASVPSTIFRYTPNARNIDDLFASCEKLAEIPYGLFDPLQNIESASYCLSNCKSLVSLPPKLFANKLYLKNVSSMFSGCSKLVTVPDDIFYGSPNIENVSQLFNGVNLYFRDNSDIFAILDPIASSIRSMKYLFDDPVIRGAVENNSFFKKLHDVDMSYAFYNRYITSISEDIFHSITNPKDISNMFYSCSALTRLPELWDESKFGTKYTSIPHSKCFSGCTNASNYDNVPNGWK